MLSKLLESTLAAASQAASEPTISFTTENVLPALEIMGLGMLGIFIVIGIIMLILRLLIKAFPPKEDNKD